MSNKVICGVCLNQTSGFCSVKKTKIKLKKRRLCDKFRQDMSKIKVKTAIPIERRPDYYWDREEKRKVLKEELRKAQEQQMAREQQAKKVLDDGGVTMIKPTDNKKHPLTGDLSRFTTTAVKKPGNKE